MCVDVCVWCRNGAQAYFHVGVSTGYIRIAQKVGDRGWRKEGDVLGSAGIIEERMDSCGPGSVWRLHLVLGGRGPGLTFGLHEVRTVLMQRVSGPSQHRWEQSTACRWQYRLAKPESREGVHWEDGPGWGGEERGSLLLTLVSAPLPRVSASPNRCWVTLLSVPRVCYVPASNKALINVCWINKLMEMFLHIKHDMLLKNSICAQLCRCASIVGYFNYIQLFLCSVYEVDCGSNIIKLIRVAS